jgi:hypothetical protein
MPLEDLAAVLRRETEKYEHLLRLIRRERGLITKGDLQALAELVKQQETLVLELKVMQEASAALMSRVSAAYRIPLAELTLFRLIDLVPASHRKSYGGLVKRLGFLASRLAEENNANKALLDRLVGYVRGSFSSLASIVVPVPMYQEDGSLVAQPRSLSILNSQA